MEVSIFLSIPRCLANWRSGLASLVSGEGFGIYGFRVRVLVIFEWMNS